MMIDGPLVFFQEEFQNEGMDEFWTLYKDYSDKCQNTVYSQCFNLIESRVKQLYKEMKQQLCLTINYVTKDLNLNDKKVRREAENKLLDEFISLIHNTYPQFRIMLDHHRNILRTETIMETLCSFLGHTADPLRNNMYQKNVQKDTVNYINHQRRGEDRTKITNTGADEYWKKHQRHGIITNENYIKERGHMNSKTIMRLENDKALKTVFLLPLRV